MFRLRTTLLLCLLFGLPGSLLPILNTQAASGPRKLNRLNAAEALARFGMAAPIITMITPEPGSPPDTIIENYNRRGMPGKITIENGASVELDYSTADGNRAQVTAERVAIPSPPDAAFNRAAASSLSYHEDPTTAFTTATVHSVTGPAPAAASPPSPPKPSARPTPPPKPATTTRAASSKPSAKARPATRSKSATATCTAPTGFATSTFTATAASPKAARSPTTRSTVAPASPER